MTRSFLFLLAGAREDGNSELLARTAAEQLPGGTGQRRLDLTRLRLPDFTDERHTGKPPRAEAEDETLLRRATLAATDIVIVRGVEAVARPGRGGGHEEGPLRSHGAALLTRVSDGTRTRGILDHNQVLYQLSYTHHDRKRFTWSFPRPAEKKCTGSEGVLAHDFRGAPPRGPVQPC